MDEKNISFDESAVKVELLTQVKSYAGVCNEYVIDDHSNEAGRVE